MSTTKTLSVTLSEQDYQIIVASLELTARVESGNISGAFAKMSSPESIAKARDEIRRARALADRLTGTWTWAHS